MNFEILYKFKHKAVKKLLKHKFNISKRYIHSLFHFVNFFERK